MPIHDVQCTLCGEILNNYYASPWPSSIRHDDGGELVILWRCSASHTALVHPRERTVVYRDPVTGKVSYPGRNDTTSPYETKGWERLEFEHARDLEKFEKQQGVINEKLWYNSGNGAE